MRYGYKKYKKFKPKVSRFSKISNFKSYKRRRRFKAYRIYFRVSKYTPSRFKVRGWKQAQRRLQWFKARGIKAYIRKSK